MDRRRSTRVERVEETDRDRERERDRERDREREGRARGGRDVDETKSESGRLAPTWLGKYKERVRERERERREVERQGERIGQLERMAGPLPRSIEARPVVP